jgi:exodeoxyribonuclease-3
MSLKLASWNVNSIKARLDHVLKWLDQSNPDVLMIQELKGTEFPEQQFKDKGYHIEAVTQKAYNGVAILSKHPINPVLNELPGDSEDTQARYLECDINNVRVINIYLPNGNPVNGPKYDYKISWMQRLWQRLFELREDEVPFLIAGDFNVIPEDKDCYDPKQWEQDALYLPLTRQHFRALLNLGLYDAFRAKNNLPEQYTYWDYQRGAWQKNHGIRIDHFLLSPLLADKLLTCTIDKTPRGWTKASDHTPIEVTLA